MKYDSVAYAWETKVASPFPALVSCAHKVKHACGGLFALGVLFFDEVDAYTRRRYDFNPYRLRTVELMDALSISMFYLTGCVKGLSCA